jgi:uncharacterized phage-like protein YoqJ
MKTLCFTGHRKINGQYNGPAHVALRNHLADVVHRAADFGILNFISGGALGVDQLGAEAVIHEKGTRHPEINLIVARPFPSQACKWPAASQRRLAIIETHAFKVEDIFPDPYKVWKMQGRNVWMVNQSNIVIAVWDGKRSGGTWNCVEYAFECMKTQDMKLLVIHPTLLTETWYEGVKGGAANGQ